MTTDRAMLVATARRVLAEHHGLAHLQRFLEAGMTRAQVAHLRHLGVLVRPRTGWYADPAVPAAGVRAVRVGGVLGCTGAAASWGIVVPEHADDRLEVSLLPGTTRQRRSDDAGRRAWASSEPHVRWHWEQHADPAVGWRVSPVDAILQLAACVEWRWLVAAVDSARCAAQHPPLLSDAEVLRLRSLLPGHLRSAVDRSDPRSETSGETMVRLAAEDAGIPFVPNQRMTSAYRVDGLVDGWLPIEIDGMASHSGLVAVEQDRARDATIAQFGSHPLRFTQNQAVRQTEWVVETIRAVWLRGSAETARHAAR
jgi:very-short-patch-repair endonuclease